MRRMMIRIQRAAFAAVVIGTGLVVAGVGAQSPVRTIEDGLIDRKDNPLKNAPHTVEDLVGEWNRPYSREQACFPPGAFRVDKYWPPVNRVDNAFGDRNLFCTCPPMDAYAEAAE